MTIYAANRDPYETPRWTDVATIVAVFVMTAGLWLGIALNAVV